MGNEQEADKFVFTNETIYGQGCRKTRRAAIGTIVSGSIVMILPVPLGLLGPSMPPGERMWMVVGCLFTGIVSLWAGIGLWREAVVRIWSFSNEGIECHDSHGQSKSLGWHQVERVRWDGREVRFRGNRKQIILPWGVIPRDRQGSTKGMIAGSLPAFNLPVVGKSQVRSSFIEVAYFLLLTVILLGTCIFFIFLLMPMAQRSTWGVLISESIFKLIWMLLALAIMTPIRILIEPIYWYDRQYSDFSKIGTPEV